MSLPYLAPTKVSTKLRCQFSLPGIRYNCRRIGSYALNGKRYCAPHYDVAWKISNPVYGQQHDWRFHTNRFSGETDAYESCRRCGEMKVHAGLPEYPCRGVMPIIELREIHEGISESANVAPTFKSQEVVL